VGHRIIPDPETFSDQSVRYNDQVPRPADPTARDRILRAAHRLFYERGINDVGMSELVEAAGTGKNVLYRHFPGKDELVLAYLRDFAERLGTQLDEATADLEPDEALVALARHVAGLVSHRSYRGCPFRNYLRETRDTKQPPGRFALAQVRDLRTRIERETAALGLDDPAALAERVWIVLEGVYAAAPYPERARIAESAVVFVEDLVA
jgi:AcrR family transcriptional regulator